MPDILIRGLRGGAIDGLIGGDVTITQPIIDLLHGVVKVHAATITGAAALVAENEKEKTYITLSRRQGYDCVAMVMETCGLMTPRFILFLRRLAAQAAGNVPTIRQAQRTRHPQQGLVMRRTVVRLQSSCGSGGYPSRARAPSPTDCAARLPRGG